jgi:flagellar biosynthesis chaperone FliJ
MPRVKFFAVTNGFGEDELNNRIQPDISDWTEVTDGQLANLRTYRNKINDQLRDDRVIGYDERLLIVTDIADHGVFKALLKIDQVIDSVAKKQKAAEEKRAATEKKRKENAEKKRVEKELKQLEKLKQKYGGVE